MLTMNKSVMTLPSQLLLMEPQANSSLLEHPSISFEDVNQPSQVEPDYEQFLADVWVGIVLTLMVLSCVCCMCSCLLYHKFQQWKRSVIESRHLSDVESGSTETDLPSYTIASGLPSYQEALEQLQKVKQLSGGGKVWLSSSSQPITLSVRNLFPLYKNSVDHVPTTKPS